MYKLTSFKSKCSVWCNWKPIQEYCFWMRAHPHMPSLFIICLSFTFKAISNNTPRSMKSIRTHCHWNCQSWQCKWAHCFHCIMLLNWEYASFAYGCTACNDNKCIRWMCIFPAHLSFYCTYLILFPKIQFDLMTFDANAIPRIVAQKMLYIHCNFGWFWFFLTQCRSKSFKWNCIPFWLIGQLKIWNWMSHMYRISSDECVLSVWS